MSDKEIDHEFTESIVCPHCGHSHSESWEYFRDDQYAQTINCIECDKPFSCEMEVDVTYITAKKEAP